MDTKRNNNGRKNPAGTSNFLSTLFFGWTIPIFWKGVKQDLHLKDLYEPLESDESERLGDRLEKEWNKELHKARKKGIRGKNGKKKPIKQPNLMWAIARIFWAPYMLQGLFLLVQATGLQILQPILQGLIISYFDQDEKVMTKNDVVLYAVSLVIVNIVTIFITHHANLHSQRIGMCIRVACCSMIYRKVLHLNKAAVNNTAAGQIANLISNDVVRFDEVFLYLHYVWIMPVQMILVGYMMWKSVGIVALVGMGIMIVQTIPIQGYLSSLIAKLRAKIAVQTDERVQLMSELLFGIQIVKMYSWEKPFKFMISKVRSIEMKFIAYASYLRSFDLSIIVFSGRVNIYFTLITFVLMGNALTAEITFVIVGLFAVQQETCNVCFPQAITLAGEAAVSLKRITAFLLLDEYDQTTVTESKDKYVYLDLEEKIIPSQQIKHQFGIEMIKVTANWIKNRIPATLHEVSMKIEQQSLCEIVGPVGSGKSSLLHLVLGELQIQTGKLSFFTNDIYRSKNTSQDIRISYASQDPWLFSGTIRNNILFDQPYNEKRYQEVTRVCALWKDFEHLPQGDLSLIGEKGATLSGGQRARVNLARAVYKDAELYLLDDPLSAVDVNVGCHLFEECITGFLKGKTRILVTHQLQYLQKADIIIALKRGTIEFQGTYKELVKSNFNLSDSGESEALDEDEYTKENCGKKLEYKVIATQNEINDKQFEFASKDDEKSPDINKEEIITGASSKIYWNYFAAGGNIFSLIFLILAFIAGQIAVSGTDYWLTYWSNQETLRTTLKFNNHTIDDHDGMHNSVKLLWLDEYGLLSSSLGIIIYTACIVSCIFLITLRGVLFARMCMNASRNIHDSVFCNLLQTTIRFFNTNPSGRILNRFSKDMGTMDELLPTAMVESFHIVTVMMGTFTLVIIANYRMITPVIIVCGLFYIVRTYYLKTARNIKRLEGIAKSPMFSHIVSTLDGLTTIRSRGFLAKGLLKNEFDRQQDVHTSAWFLSIASGAAFGLTIDLISCFFIACVSFSFILIDNGNIFGGFVGLAISQSLTLTDSIQEGVRQSTELISQIISVERILQYIELPKEESRITGNPLPPTWPSKGCLIFKGVSMRYAEHEPLVLKDLNMKIEAGWKVGIVGRTGAGKSSLISALFRLTGDGLSGEITLDGIDTKSIGLQELRPRISIIPQEPILFSATLRYNLDPLEQHSDTELWNSLKEVELGDIVPSLDFRVADGGVNFSVGQRQLICLVRAMLTNNRLLVLDEATANVDHATDTLIQNTIRRRFADCTVLTIAHRLNTIMDSDRVLVISDGCITEFGHPHLLLKNREGDFSKMLRENGRTDLEKLREIAKNAFLQSDEFRTRLNEPS